MKSSERILVRAMLLSAVRCSTSTVEPPPFPACSLNSECRDSLICAFGHCHVACQKSVDCAAGQRCVKPSGLPVCQDPTEARCNSTADCGEGLTCGVDHQCRNACSSNPDCLTNQVCASSSCAEPKELVDGKLPGAPQVSDASTDVGDDSSGADVSAIPDAPSTPDVPDVSADTAEASSDQPEAALEVGAVGLTCGQPSQACCAGESCNAFASYCVSSVCTCGGSAEACCPSNACRGGGVCAGRVCSCVSACEAYGSTIWAAAVRSSDGSIWYEDPSIENGPNKVTLPDGSLLRGAAAVSIGDFYACSRHRDGTAWCYGVGGSPSDNASSQRGDGRTGIIPEAERKWAVQVRQDASGTPLSNVISLTLGGTWGCAATSPDGQVYCWGDNFGSHLGNGTAAPTPFAVPALTAQGPLLGVDQLSLGSWANCAHRTDGTVWCWGSGAHNQLAAGSEDTSTVAIAIPRFGSETTGVAVNFFDTCAAMKDGKVRCIGGDYTKNQSDKSARLVRTAQGDLTEVSELVASGGTGFCALRRGGDIWCWQDGGLAQIFINVANVPIEHAAFLGRNNCYVRDTGEYEFYGNPAKVPCE